MKGKMKIKQMIEPEALKEAMRAWMTGVAIVTGRYEEAFHGMTANSFNSLALDPPTVLVALRHRTRTQQLVRKGQIFGVSILDIHQLGLAKRFAGQYDQDRPRFEGVDTFQMETGAPLISNAIAYLDCKVVKDFDIGDTTVFIGEVLASRVETQDDKEPLLYYNRQWRRLQRP
jgi:flavin reductase (DIM6/NTAB) family NADH-FMN oxidoreductase RutF